MATTVKSIQKRLQDVIDEWDRSEDCVDDLRAQLDDIAGDVAAKADEYADKSGTRNEELADAWREWAGEIESAAASLDDFDADSVREELRGDLAEEVKDCAACQGKGVLTVGTDEVQCTACKGEGEVPYTAEDIEENLDELYDERRDSWADEIEEYMTGALEAYNAP